MQRRLPFAVRLIPALVFICLGSTFNAHLLASDCSALEQRIHDLAVADLGVREKTGRNDHPLIAKWNRRVGVPINSPYCASWVVNKLLDAGVIEVPLTAWSPSLFPKHARVMWAGVLIPGKKLRMMDVLGMWFKSRKRIAHVGFFLYTLGDHIRSIEANTSTTAVSGSAEDRDATTGGGVVYKTRHRRAWYGASSFKNCKP